MSTAVRIWKRDRSRNVMPLDAAVANLHDAMLADGAPAAAADPDAIAGMLRAGQTLETPRAYFRVGR
jgi:hypothetical protein